MLRILYGGTFDPVHNGHLAVADAAARCFATDVWLLPAADPPHRAAPGADAIARAAMLDLAIVGHPRLRVDRRELRRAGPSYTVETLHAVRAQIGESAPLAWLLGADAFAGLPQWHRWREVFALAHLIVALRPGYALDPAVAELQAAIAGRRCSSPLELSGSAAGRWFPLSLPPQPESASEVRAGVRACASWSEQVPAAVAAYIRSHCLYGAGAASEGS